MSAPKDASKLKVVEIFYSVQGEGANVGMPAIFIRLAHCNKDCWFCDTNWDTGAWMSMEDIIQTIAPYPCKNIIWTGGEPTLQLTDEVLEYFPTYYHCIETNGTNPVPQRIDYISCSPKVSTDILRKNFSFVNEFRYPLAAGDTLPALSELPKADNYFVSPIFIGKEQERFDISPENLAYCMAFVKANPLWRISIQMHKLLNIP